MKKISIILAMTFLVLFHGVVITAGDGNDADNILPNNLDSGQKWTLTPGQTDFLTLKLGDSKQATTEKLEFLEERGEIKPVSQFENTYQTVFLNESAVFETSFYKEQLISIIFTFEAQFTEAEYDDRLKNFFINKIQPGLNERYGSATGENPFPDRKYFIPNKSIWLSRYITPDVHIYSGITKKENLYLVDVSIYDIKLTQAQWSELKQKVEEQEQIFKKLQKELEELKAGSS